MRRLMHGSCTCYSQQMHVCTRQAGDSGVYASEESGGEDWCWVVEVTRFQISELKHARTQADESSNSCHREQHDKTAEITAYKFWTRLLRAGPLISQALCSTCTPGGALTGTAGSRNSQMSTFRLAAQNREAPPQQLSFHSELKNSR